MSDPTLEKIFTLHLQGFTAKEIAEAVSLGLTATKNYLRAINFHPSTGNVEKLARTNHWNVERTKRALKQVRVLKDRMTEGQDLVRRGLSSLRDQLPKVLTQELLIGPTVWRSSGILGYGENAIKPFTNAVALGFLEVRCESLYEDLLTHLGYVQELRRAVMALKASVYPNLTLPVERVSHSPAIFAEAVFSWLLNHVADRGQANLESEILEGKTPVTDTPDVDDAQRVELDAWRFEVSGHDPGTDWKFLMADFIRSIYSGIIDHTVTRTKLEKVLRHHKNVSESAITLGNSLDDVLVAQRVPQSLSS